jgi:DNA mismatch repair protein MutL
VRQIVQLNDMYLLVETDSGVRIVDQHALHEKALWLALGPEATAFEAHGSQETFLARSYTLSAGEVAAVETHLPGLAAHGIEAEVFGPTTILVRHFPALLRRLDWGLFFAELASAGESADPVAALRERLGHRAACRAAVKAGQRLTRAEMLELVRLLLHVERIEHCPHGRPTVLDLPWGELERRFQR